MKRACSYGVCGKRKKPFQEQSPLDPPGVMSLHTNSLPSASLETAPQRSKQTQLPEEVVQNILKFGGGAPRCNVLKGKAYLFLGKDHFSSRMKYKKSDTFYNDLYDHRNEDIFGSVSAIANDQRVVCKEKCNDWKSYTERCISKSMNSHFDVITSFYLVMKTLYDSVKKLFPPSAPAVPFVMTLSVLKRKVPSASANPPLIRCYSSGINYFFGHERMYTFKPVPGSDSFKVQQYNHPRMASGHWLALSIASLNEYTFKLEFDAEDLDVEHEGSLYSAAEKFYGDTFGFVEFSFAALSGSEDKLFSSLRQVAKAYS